MNRSIIIVIEVVVAIIAIGIILFKVKSFLEGL